MLDRETRPWRWRAHAASKWNEVSVAAVARAGATVSRRGRRMWGGEGIIHLAVTSNRDARSEGVVGHTTRFSA